MNGTFKMIKNIEKVPSQSYSNSHYFCDYIELLALINNNDLLAVADVYDRFYEDNSIEIPENNSDIDLGSEVSQTNDIWESRIKEWFSILDTRKNIFGDFYPFKIEHDTIHMCSELTYKQLLYIFLLLNSNQNYIRSNSQLTSDFEEFSLRALKNFLPSNAQCYRFGKSMLDQDRYKGNISKKIDDLAKDLKYSTKYKEHYFASNDNGDGGLDIVSWIPFKGDENQNNMQVYLCQCATGKEWYKKQDDTDKFVDNYIDFRTQVNLVMFIPFDGRNMDRTFNEEAKMKKNIIFDRVRLVYLLQENQNLITELKSFEIVNQIIAFEEDIV